MNTAHTSPRLARRRHKMSTLSATLSIAVGALAAEQSALSETANNVANLNTPGYSRTIPNFVENPPVVLGPLTFGTGVSLGPVTSVRDPILQIRIQQETGQQGHLDALVAGLKQVEAQFSNQGSDIGSQLSALFASLSQLSTDPTSLATRQGVLAAASNLSATFRNTVNSLVSQQKSIDLSVTQAVVQVNTTTQQIAKLNGEIASLQNVGQDASSFVDQRDVLINQLSGLIDVSQIKTESGVTLTTSNGTALVAGNQSFALTTQPDVSGLQRIFAQGNDITGQVNSGELGGLLAVRDQKIPALLSSLDTFAAALANAFNSANAAGFDLNGNAGANIFTPPPAGQGAAAAMGVAMTDPELIAASSDGSAGSNGNLANFASIHDQGLIASTTPSDYYSGLIFNLGNDIANGSAELQSSQLVLQQLQDQRGSISGVSLDEEAAHMVQYQRAYEAAARMVTTVDQMLYTVIHMGVSG
jgi:flagellar hook-associated protein 1